MYKPWTLPAIDEACAVHSRLAHLFFPPQDAFYASVIEAETPALRSRPLAVQQKQIVVTCNYEARRRVRAPAFVVASTRAGTLSFRTAHARIGK